MKTISDLNNPDQKGFTLLEIMVAIAIIAIAFTSVLKLHTRTVAMNIASNFYAKAPLLVQKIISEWETGRTTDDFIPTSLGDSLEEFPGFTVDITHETLASDAFSSETQGDNDRVLVEIVCTILYHQGEYQYTTKTLRFISP
ncbi:prepilin-type N-terminal cleavage/methylation domain-containing protein [Desulfobacula sp.]|uniref:type IV pilus modification PilV family protein n=1 Tax=Desulfobacula sp. TaxID=2593537 RepID=UPI0026192484|nr:prepilin-type N-terminal cleavage/methylation domain-containing protein [Desulfobacula sp.]